MKTELTREESQHLIDLGVPKEKASGKYITPQGKPIVTSVGIINETAKIYPVFKLEDFLNGEILPIEIGDRNRIIESGSRGHIAYYAGIYGVIGWKPAVEELIDALYQLSCWYYGKYLKSEKK